jgi:hypothetical protein
VVAIQWSWWRYRRKKRTWYRRMGRRWRVTSSLGRCSVMEAMAGDGEVMVKAGL